MKTRLVVAGVVALSLMALLPPAAALDETPRFLTLDLPIARDEKPTDLSKLDGPLSAMVRGSGDRESGVHPSGRVGHGRVRVEIEVRDAVKTALVPLEELDGRVEFRYKKTVQATLPLRNLRSLAKHAGIRKIATPTYSSEFAVQGEGTQAINADDWHAAGLTGQGVKIGIVDAGFEGYTSLQSSGDLPSNLVAVDGCANGFTQTDHGTAVAEIVYEVAPSASLYLICASTSTETGAALSYAKQQGIKLITSSIGTAGLDRGDGSGGAGSRDAIVEDAAASGILWINAAGNYAAGGHWSGRFTDTNGDGIHDFSSTESFNELYIASGDSDCIILKWDNWPATFNDFDMYLLRGSDGAVVAASEFEQSGTQEPIEGVCYENTGASGFFAIFITKYSAASAPRFDMYSNLWSFQHWIAAGSVAEPASNPTVLGVGAVCWSQNTAESFSSRGPTIDGRIKPDIAGVDSVSSGSYGPFSSCPSGFAGTSAAAPHVAGAAALVMQQNPTWNAADVRAYLESNATDLGTSGKDNNFGAGKLLLPTPTAQPSPTPTPTAQPSPTPTPTAQPSPTVQPSPTPTPGNEPEYHPRSVTFAMSKHLVAKGSVTTLDGFNDCSIGAPISIEKRINGRWKRQKLAYSNLYGRFKIRMPDQPGLYRARSVPTYIVAAPDENCMGAVSTTKRHRH